MTAPLIFQRPTVRSERQAWTIVMRALALTRFLGESAPKIRREIAKAIRERRALDRSFCEGCKFFPGDKLRRSEKDPGEGARPCLAGEEMGFRIIGEIHAEQIGWARDGCSKRERGTPVPEPSLPPFPWFRIERSAAGWYASLRNELGRVPLRREVGTHAKKALAREAASRWANRQGLRFTEQLKGWERAR